jgi:hypothetical protein
VLKRLCPVLAAGIIAALAAVPAALAACPKQAQQSTCSSTAATCVYIEPNGAGQSGCHTISQSVDGKLNRYHGKDASQLRTIAALGPGRRLSDNQLGGVAPSTLGAAFDVGLGPILLFGVLLGTAVFLAGYNGVRRRRHR